MTRIKQNDYTPKLGVVAQPRDVISTTPLTPMRTADIAGAFSDVLPSLMQARKDYNDEKIKDYEAMARRGEALTDEQSKDWRAIEAYERIGARRSLAEADVKFTELLAKTKGDLPAFEKGKTEMLDSLLTNASDTFANEIGDQLHALTSRYTAQAVRLNEQELATELKADAQGTLLSQINAEMPPGLDLSSSTKAFSSYEKALQAIKATDVRGMISTMQKDYMDLS